MKKQTVEMLLVRAELKGIPEKGLLKSRHLITVDLIWPRSGSSRKTSSRQATFTRGKVDFTAEPWVKRILHREDIDGHCGIAVTISEALTLQKVRKYLRLVAKAAIKEGADFIEGSLVAYGDIAAAPIDALAAMVSTTDTPKAIAQGAIDFTALPAEGEIREIEIPLLRPLTGKTIGRLVIQVAAN